MRGSADRVTRHQGLTKWKNGISSDWVEPGCGLIRHLGHLVRQQQAAAESVRLRFREGAGLNRHTLSSLAFMWALSLWNWMNSSKGFVQTENRLNITYLGPTKSWPETN